VVAAGGVGYRAVAWSTTVGCDGCHGDQAGKAHPVYSSGPAGSTTANSHVKHVEGSTLSCDYCHLTTTTDTATYPALPASVVNGGAHLSRTEDVSFKSVGGKTGSWNSTAKTCAATYCHGSSASLAWGSTTNCGSCHGASNTTLSTRHDKHYNSAALPTWLTTGPNAHTATNYVYACGVCHPTTTHAKGPATAGQQDAEIGGTWQTAGSGYTAGATWTTDSNGFLYTRHGTCATLCHTKDGATPGTSIYAANWGTTNGAGCGFCHSRQGDANPTWTTPHSKHINTYVGNTNFTCNSCHSGTASDNANINGSTGRDQHPNGVKDLAFNAYATGSWNTSAKQCSNTYCHSTGTSLTAPTHGAISWSGAVDCGGCHGGWTTGPSYANNSPKPNSHIKHTVGYSYTCYECHSSTVAAGATPGITSFSRHLDKAYEVTGGKITSYWYTSTGGTCSTSCHYSTTPKWGGASLGCGGCHAFPPADDAHLYHVQNWLSLTQSYTNTEVKSSSAAYNFGCGNCHPTDPSKHGNGTVDVGLSNADGGTLKSANAGWASYNSTSKVCSGVYCHSDGSNGSSSTFALSPAWTVTASAWDATANKCGQCHGNPPQYANQAHWTSAAFMGREGGHMLGVHSDNVYDAVNKDLMAWNNTVDSAHGNATVSTTMSCGICHSGIVSWTTIDTYSMNGATGSAFKCDACHSAGTPTKLQSGVITDKSLHVNGSKDVVFANIVMKSKAQLRDNTATWTTTVSVWNRSGSYKASGSYDWATLGGVSTWNAGSKTCTTACHNGKSATWTSVTTLNCSSCHDNL